jgi:hypothetical protein
MERLALDGKNPVSSNCTEEGEVSAQNRSSEYTRYINSPEWRVKRNEFLDRYISRHGSVCQHCGRRRRWLEVHHRIYRTPLHQELDGDLEVLCRSCHEQADLRRETRVAWETDPLFDEKLDEWATRRYGQYWHDGQDGPDGRDEIDIAEEFAMWLENQRVSELSELSESSY